MVIFVENVICFEVKEKILIYSVNMALVGIHSNNFFGIRLRFFIF